MIEFRCAQCRVKLNAQPEHGRKTKTCPKCRAALVVPPAPKPPRKAAGPSQNQLRFADTLGVVYPADVTKEQLSDLISRETGKAPATDRQRAFAIDLGIEFDGGVTKYEIGKLIDAAIDRQETEENKLRELRVRKLLWEAEPNEILEELGWRGFRAVLICAEESDDGQTSLGLSTSQGMSIRDIEETFLMLFQGGQFPLFKQMLDLAQKQARR
jgi:hypothetical protein